MRMKILASVVVTMLFSVSALVQADNSIVTGASTDTLGLPSSALLLTETESNNIRGKKYRAHKALVNQFDDLGCEEQLASDQSTVVCVTLQRDIDDAYMSWQAAVAKHKEVGKKWTLYWRKNAY